MMGTFLHRKRKFVIAVTTDPIQLAYAAGIIDGEGCVTIYKLGGGRSYGLMIRVSMTNLPVVQWLAKALSGLVGTKSRWGKDYYLPQYRWEAVGDHAYAVLSAIRPYVVGKQEQVDLGLKFYERLHAAPRGGYKMTQHTSETLAFCEVAYQEMKSLKANGGR